MDTSLEHLALLIAEDCDSDQAKGVFFWSLLAVAVLFLQFGWLAWAAVIGAVVGLALREMASRGARRIRKSFRRAVTLATKSRSESRALKIVSRDSAKRLIFCLLQKVTKALGALFVALGIVHVALSKRLFPRPYSNRA